MREEFSNLKGYNNPVEILCIDSVRIIEGCSVAVQVIIHSGTDNTVD